MIAAKYGHHAVVTMLIAAGADVNHQDEQVPQSFNQRSGVCTLPCPLFCAAGSVCPHGGYPRHAICYSRNPYSGGSGYQCTEQCKTYVWRSDALTAHGCILLLIFQNGETALMCAVGYWGPQDIVDLLLQAGADVNIADHVSNRITFFLCGELAWFGLRCPCNRRGRRRSWKQLTGAK
jgi:hypothetical protein